MLFLKRSGLITGIILLLAVVIAGYLTSPVLAQEDVDQEKLDRGAQMYQENCAVCHGSDGQGRVGATLNQNWPSIRPDLTVKSIITNGIPGTLMPAWSVVNGGPLSETQIDDLVYFILSWQNGLPPSVNLPSPTPRPPIQPIPGVEGDPNRGGVLYDENCAVCHGSNGQGRIGASLSDNWPSIRPDLSVKNIIVTGIQGSQMPAWSTSNGGPLSEDDINDITAFVLTLSEPEGSSAVEPTPAPQSTQPGVSWFIWIGAIVVVIAVGIYLSTRKK